MSGPWMAAGDRTVVYRQLPGESGDGYASNLVTRAVLRELCRVAHDAGIAQIGVDRLADRLGAGERTIRYALLRLQRDGTITRAVRGVGNKHGTGPRESVFILHPLPDKHGEMHPALPWLDEAWQRYMLTPRWDRFGRDAQRAIADARHPVDNSPAEPLQPASSPPTSGKPLPHISLDRSQLGEPPQQQRRHPHAAKRDRAKLAVVPPA